MRFNSDTHTHIIHIDYKNFASSSTARDHAIIRFDEKIAVPFNAAGIKTRQDFIDALVRERPDLSFKLGSSVVTEIKRIQPENAIVAKIPMEWRVAIGLAAEKIGMKPFPFTSVIQDVEGTDIRDELRETYIRLRDANLIPPHIPSVR